MKPMTKPIALIPLLAILIASSTAHALQPLDEFVRGARARNPANREAAANHAGAEARADEAFGHALPALFAAATYTRNQWDVNFGGLEVAPLNQRDAAATLAVPLVDLAKWEHISAAERLAEAAGHREEAVARATESQVAQLYYQLAADLSLADVARKALDVVRRNLAVTEEAARAGTVTGLDVQRASVEVERQNQQLIAAELEVRLVTRALASQTGVVADVAAPPALADDLHQ